jgi:hypothetical protein
MQMTKALMLCLGACLWLANVATMAKTIRFSGHDWVVRPAGKGGPGPNSKRNADTPPASL